MIDQGDDVTGLEVTGDVTGNGNRATGFDGIDDIVWSNVGIEGNRRDGSGIDRITFGIGNRSRGITGRIGGDERGIDGCVRISGQVTTGDINAEAAIGENPTGGIHTINRKVTISPVWKSPETLPVTATVPPASTALMISSGVMLPSSVIVAVAVVSTV